jgi:PAS domain S-box-containing protein
MFNEIKIGSKITMLLLSVVLLSVLAISFISFRLSKDSIEKRYWESLSVMANLKANELQAVFKQLEYNVNFIQKSQRVQESILQSRQSSDIDSMETVISNRLNDYMLPIQEMYGYKNILLLDVEGKIIYKSNKIAKNQIIGQVYAENETLKEKANNSLYYGDLYKVGKNVYMNVAAPITNQGGAVIGHVVAEFNMDKIYQITDDTTGLKGTGEIFIAKMVGSKIDLLNKERDASSTTVLTQTILAGDERMEALQRACKEEEGYGYTIDQTGKNTMANWKYIRPIGWGLIVKIDLEEINKDLDALIYAFIFAGIIITVIAFIISFLFSRVLIAPLLSLKATLNAVARGILPNNVNRETNDEIGEMATAVSNLVAALRRTANFAHAIGEGNYDAHFKPMSIDDTLGNALITMRDSIEKADERDNERNWIVTGVAEISQILRLHNNLEELGSNIISFVAEKIGAIQGAFYVVEEDEDDGRQFLEMKASYAYGRKKYLKSKFNFAEGLVGQAAVEQDTILRVEVPDDYVTITSGILGDRKPKCLLLVPLITDEKVYGVLELAGFEKFSPMHVAFTREISVIIARTIFNIKVNERTVLLLQESQQMGEELQHQQSILRQNAEDMADTQEELKRTNTRLEEQILEVNRTQKRMQVLLENASEVITIYERDAKVRYISPSVEPILGYTQEELIGVTDIMNVCEGSKDEYEELFKTMLNEPNKKATVQFEYQCKDGTTVWLEATGTNLLSDPAIRGLVVNSRDITERRLAEKEARMRGQMQSLSENSLDLITRLNREGTIFYINPIIKNLTGMLPEDLLGKNMYEVGFRQEIITDWKGIISDVMDKNAGVNKEVTFPTKKGDLTMNINALPEYNEHEELESILLVAHDITERKQTELEILSINKKITESINYAKRIQEAILPNTTIIQELLPDSFIYYKPKDVVSGDFPWFLHSPERNEVFIAAVDCTGHGVPGALISLIGYFLLNDVVRTQKEYNTGKILDLLNLGVTKTLRQDSGTKEVTTRDGMDIALCRINLSNNEVQYAGAHRPLYVVQNGELTVIDGDKAPIGGGQLKKRDSFNCTTLNLVKGNQFYVFSDGVADQFGGTEGKKYSPRRIREVIVANQGLSMPEMQKAIFDDFDAWKGTTKQTDDLLMIGVRF